MFIGLCLKQGKKETSLKKYIPGKKLFASQLNLVKLYFNYLTKNPDKDND